MKKDELFRYAIKELALLADATEEDILRGRDEEASDLRHVLVLVLGRVMTDTDLARRMERTRQGVNYIRRSGKQKWSVERNRQELGKKVERFLLSD
jgi:hypothetical protein